MAQSTEQMEDDLRQRIFQRVKKEYLAATLRDARMRGLDPWTLHQQAQGFTYVGSLPWDKNLTVRYFEYRG
jgi:hypothetical protein